MSSANRIDPEPGLALMGFAQLSPSYEAAQRRAFPWCPTVESDPPHAVLRA